AIAAVAPPSAEAFFENPALSGALISPDGNYLAAKIGAKGKRNMLAVVDLATKKAQIVAHFSDTDIGNVQWVNAQRLLFDTADREAAQGDADYAPGLYAVDQDGGRFKQLASRMGEGLKISSAQRDMLPWHTAMLQQTGPQDSDWAYVNDQVVDNRGIIEHVRLLRVNTVTGRTQSVE